MRIFLSFAFVMFFCLTGCQQTSNTPVSENAQTISGEGDVAANATDAAEIVGDAESEKSEDAAHESKSGIKTKYTDLVENKCRDIDSNEEGEWSVQECDGVGGYKLNVSEGDLRQSIDIITPDKKKYELNLWQVVSGAFSTVGDKAEWRVVEENGKIRPVALIVRYNASENPEDAEKITSYLTVSKITPTGACVTHVIKPMPGANLKAREFADTAADKPCKK